MWQKTNVDINKCISIASKILITNKGSAKMEAFWLQHSAPYKSSSLYIIYWHNTMLNYSLCIYTCCKISADVSLPNHSVYCSDSFTVIDCFQCKETKTLKKLNG